KNSFFILFSFFLMFSFQMKAQEVFPNNPISDMEGLEAAEDEFQEYFFEALKQKAIENYRPALEALQKAENATNDADRKSVVYFEMGKIYFKLKEYLQAEKNYQISLTLTGERQDVLEHLYDVYYQQNNYAKALDVV